MLLGVFVASAFNHEDTGDGWRGTVLTTGGTVIL